MIEGIIFDMDGLMLDTERVVQLAMTQVFDEMGMEGGKEVSLRMIGRTSAVCREIMVEAVGSSEKAEEIFSRSRAIQQKYFAQHGMPVKKGLFQLMDYLEAQGIKMAVASSTRRELVELELREVGAWERLDAAVCGDEVTHSKPHPEIFQTACAKLGLPPEKAMVLEDSIPGVQAAYAAGIPVVLVPDLVTHPQESLDKTLAVCQDLSQVIDIIEQMKK